MQAVKLLFLLAVLVPEAIYALLSAEESDATSGCARSQRGCGDRDALFDALFNAMGNMSVLQDGKLYTGGWGGWHLIRAAQPCANKFGVPESEGVPELFLKWRRNFDLELQYGTVEGEVCLTAKIIKKTAWAEVYLESVGDLPITNFGATCKSLSMFKTLLPLFTTTMRNVGVERLTAEDEAHFPDKSECGEWHLGSQLKLVNENKTVYQGVYSESFQYKSASCAEKVNQFQTPELKELADKLMPLAKGFKKAKTEDMCKNLTEARGEFQNAMNKAGWDSFWSDCQYFVVNLTRAPGCD